MPIQDDDTTYEDGYKKPIVTFEDDFDYKPPFDEVFDHPSYADEFGADFVANFEPEIDFELDVNNYKGNFDYDDEQKPGGYVSSKPTYQDDYSSKPAYVKPAPKPYKPKPEYPKQVVLLTPSAALKPQAYAHKVTKDYYHGGKSIPGVAGKDYPNYTAVPSTSFDCLSVKHSDYSYMFADTETGCQVFHSCHADGRQDSFLCPEGTIFDAETQTVSDLNSKKFRFGRDL